jgi:NAD(P)-dependent dehydrogenase (short-subunit alcohol dehydrogenase family)
VVLHAAHVREAQVDEFDVVVLDHFFDVFERHWETPAARWDTAGRAAVQSDSKARASIRTQRFRANVIAPGLVDTQMAGRAKSDPALLEQVAFWQPLGPLGRIEDVASAAVFLGSDESRFITGAVLPVDGGWTAQ